MTPEMLTENVADGLRMQMIEIMTGRVLPGSVLTDVIEIWAHGDAHVDSHTDHTDHADGPRHSDS